jgi:tetrapyrrole methylase family protein/MazG family protein
MATRYSPRVPDEKLPDLTPLPGKQTGAEVTKLVGLMQRLLAPDGCPWDREQTLETLVPYLVEETYEVVDALAAGDVDDHREELGDLLLQIVFQSELRYAEGKFGIDDVARGIVAKLVHRHPHVFGDVVAKDADAVLANWAKLKAAEKAKKGKHGALDGVPKSAPALLRATRTGEKAGAVGFDWTDAEGPRAKIEEELREFDEARRGGDRARMQEELGDLLFSAVNLARRLGLDAEQALRDATDRFARRFGHVERTLAAQGRAISDAPPDEQDRLWEAAKRADERAKRAEVDAPEVPAADRKG